MANQHSLPTIFELGRPRSLPFTFCVCGAVYLACVGLIVALTPLPETSSEVLRLTGLPFPATEDAAIRPTMILYCLGFFTIPIVFWFCRELFESWIGSMMEIDGELPAKIPIIDTSFLGPSHMQLAVGPLLGLAAVYVFNYYSVIGMMEPGFTRLVFWAMIFMSASIAGVALVSFNGGIRLMVDVSQVIKFDLVDIRGGLDETGSCLSRCYIAIAVCWLPYALADIHSQVNVVEPWFQALGISVYPIFFLIGLPVSLFLVTRFFEVHVPLQRRVRMVIREKTKALSEVERNIFDGADALRQEGRMQMANSILQLRKSIEDAPLTTYSYFDLLGAFSPLVLPIATQLFGKIS